jgi:rhamnogalacturonyl hydrolase YesR
MNPITSALCFFPVRIPERLAGLAALGLLLGVSLRAQDGAARPPAPALFSGSQMQPEYPVQYRAPTVEEITGVMNRVRDYQESASLMRIINRKTREEITDLSTPNPDAVLDRGENNAFPLIGYEEGVIYAGMLAAAEVTGDARFAEFTAKRFQFAADRLPFFRTQYRANLAATGAVPLVPGTMPTPAQMRRYEFRNLVDPQTLDDAGAMCAAMIKARRAGVGPDLLSVIKTYIEHISHKQFRLADGTLARTNPQPETLWLDDMYMSIPALAQMGKLSGESRYYDDAVRQVLQFSARMFDRQKGLYMHCWSSNTPDHPEFCWARANGWAAMAMVELLDVLPEDHPRRAEVLDQLRAHLRGLAACQSGAGLWHQLLDRNDSYLETSASAMFVFSMARAINRDWVSPVAFGPAAQLGWNAVAAKVNAKGQVEDTCVGTGVAFDPMYYYQRPRSPFAQHGYGPVLLAGAEMIRLLKSDRFTIAAGIIQFIPQSPKP